MSGQKIIDALDEILQWTRGKGKIRIRMPNGVSSEMTVDEYRDAMYWHEVQNSNRSGKPNRTDWQTGQKDQ